MSNPLNHDPCVSAPIIVLHAYASRHSLLKRMHTAAGRTIHRWLERIPLRGRGLPVGGRGTLLCAVLLVGFLLPLPAEAQRMSSPQIGIAEDSITTVPATQRADQGHGRDRYGNGDSGTHYLLPTGWQLRLAQTFGELARVQFGAGYWFNDDWGVSFDAGFHFGTRDLILERNGESQLVRRTRYDIIPEIGLMHTLATAGNKRLIMALAGGPLIRKDEGQETGIGYVLHAGPGIDWPLSKQFSIHYEQWLSLISAPLASEGTQLVSQPQLSLIWWFE